MNGANIAEQLAPLVVDAMNFTAQFKIIAGVDGPKGKWAEALGNVITIDSFDILNQVYDNFEENLKEYRDDPVLRDDNPVLAFIADQYFNSTLAENARNTTQNIKL